MAIGEKLRKLRNKTKYSQQDVADILEIDRVTYTNWENGTSDIKSQYIPKLAEIFNVKIEDLFDIDPKLQINNFENNDSATGQQGIIINISDSETAKLLSEQIQELIKNLKK
ncbi:MAG: helix-turn-helix domain-containing protein [Streptococcaceae bacterium]|jgi:transcriptional regulator with XRE-family HTH domain|nr:helix-turn-helix domain-containing protein [Streptococcaceae bacterium]